VGVGAYRCDQGMPFVLPVVREAENEINLEELDHEYSGIAGCPNFVNLALRFVYGEDSAPLNEGRVAGVQTLSGTGGLRVFGEVLHQFGHKHIYVVRCISIFIVDIQMLVFLSHFLLFIDS